jgi:aminopeptidase N
MRRFARLTTVASSVAVLVAALAAPAAAHGPTFSPGAPGVGDPYFPSLGNGGFNVARYDLDLSYQPDSHELSGTAGISARATQNLSRFDLDLLGMTVDSISVNGQPATFTRAGRELKITPSAGLVKGSDFDVSVSYHGKPKTIKGSPIVFGADYGWQYTKDGAFVGDEPNAASTWFPSNDHPSDKARFTFRITVPSAHAVVANGSLKSRHIDKQAGTKTYTWVDDNPTATYLATIDIGHWHFVNGTTPNGIPETMAYDPSLENQVKRDHVFALTGKITDYWTKKFGPYPFDSTGAIVDNVPNVGFSLETETRPLYGFSPDPGTMAHELAHQWFGDSVSVATWQHIWLNEGFATFAAWLWDEHTGGPSTDSSARATYRFEKGDHEFWDQSIADPKRNTMFSNAVYERGGMTLAALRDKIGSTKFFDVLQQWTADHHFGNATTAQFEQLAEQVSGKSLSSFFHKWLVAKHRPRSFE